MSLARGLAVLGATGSIGMQTLDVVRAHPGRFTVAAVSANRNVERLSEIIREFRPAFAAVGSEEEARHLRALFPSLPVGHGEQALSDAAGVPGVELVVNALLGAAGIGPTLTALGAGRDVALANKETLVAAGTLVMEAAARGEGTVIPMDSEHSAVAQCLQGYERSDVEKLILTASGGPFLRRPAEDLASVRAQDALKHPTWTMGRKITIDSATLMNKGFEVIEAHFLFGMPYEEIEVLIHPQSIVHSLVQFRDGAVLAQLGAPDMRVPIQFALLGAARERADWGRLDLARVGRLEFEEPDREQFPALSLAYECGRTGGTYPAVLNGANEVAVQRFLEGDLDFPGILGVVRKALDAHGNVPRPGLEEILGADEWARSFARSAIRERSRTP